MVKGPQHYSVENGNASFKPLKPGHEHLLPPRNQVSKPMAPQGRFNEYIIDGHFHRFKPPEELLTEKMAQYVNCNPWIRQEIFDEVSQACKENGLRAASVSSCITGHLYEDRTTLVNRGPWNAGCGHNVQLHRSPRSSTASDAPLHTAKLS